MFTARKPSLGQGNAFTPVCHSVWGVYPTSLDVDPLPLDADPPGVDPHPQIQIPSPLDADPWDADPPDADPPPRYGQQAGGTHPTGMHNCLTFDFYLFSPLFL